MYIYMKNLRLKYISIYEENDTTAFKNQKFKKNI